MDLNETTVGTAALPRMLGCFIGQSARALRCPPHPDLAGRIVAITGATNGIGLETARGLLERGATVVMLARNAAKAERVLEDFGADADAFAVPLDLGDLSTLPGALEEIRRRLDGRQIDVLIENAGVSPQRFENTAQGHEIAFGTNVLGHFALRAGLLRQALLSPSARVVIVTGDIYITESDCTSNFRYRGRLGGVRAYSRSKLGNFWIGRELQRRHPELTVTLVHPGVVASNLMVGPGVLERLSKHLLLSAVGGAQTSLICATQAVLSGGYYHNTRGLTQLSPGDPALNDTRAEALWRECEALAAPFLTEPAPSVPQPA